MRIQTIHIADKFAAQRVRFLVSIIVYEYGPYKTTSCMELSDDKHTTHIHGKRILPYSERKIESLEALTSLMQGMDLDEGIRIVGQVKEFKGGGFIFVAKSGNRYCINICDRILDPAKRTYFVGGNDEWWYFDTFEEAWQKLKPLLNNPIEAYSY